MRLLFVSQSSPFKEGGAETRTREVALRLARAGHEVTVLCGKTSADDPLQQQVEGVTVLCRRVLPDFLLRRFPYPHYLPLAAANLLLMFHVAAMLRRRRFDLMREDIAPFPPTFLLAFLKLRARRLAVMHMQPERFAAWVRHYGLYGVAGYLMGRLLRVGVLKYDAVVCAAAWFAAALRRYPAIEEKVVCIPNGVDLAVFSPRPAGMRAGPDIRLLCVGRLAETKGHRYLIEALAVMRRHHPRISLDIVGNGGLRDELIELARRRGVEALLKVRPPVAHRDMPGLYRDCDFFVLPSLWEGQPVSLIEAMACGVPAVVTRIEATEEVLGPDGAIFAEPGDAQDLARQLLWAIEHRAVAGERAERARQRARGFDWTLAALRELEVAAAAQPAGGGTSQGGRA